MRSANTSYIKRLDHLRFYAAAIVILYHVLHQYVGELQPHDPLLSLIDEGHTGVSLFMVLSGFIFSVISFRKNISYSGFILNRFIRIYPLYTFAILFSAYISRSQYTFLDVLSSLVPFSNLKGGVTAPYFTQLWTVAVEFQFYLIFPFIKRFFDAYGARYIFGFLILVVVLRFMVFTIDGTVQDLAYWTIFGKIDQFLIGMLIGDLYCRKSGICNNPAYFLAALALVFLCMQWMDNHGGFYGFHGSGYPSKAGWWVLWPTVEGSMWGFFTLTYLNSRWTLGKGVEASLARVGATSFSMYVMHWFVMSAVEKTVGLPNVTGNNVIDALLLGGFVVLPATVALSAATYWIIERPFLVLRKRYVAPKPIVAHV